MSKLDEAQQRLQRAVFELEEAARKTEASNRSSTGGVRPDSQIAVDLESARTRIAELENANFAIAQRLDGAIDRIKTILEK
ncbi:MAG: hypothetical protein CMM16_02380 [Rhodospirillaceae bacterium]|nr:hypothetical protein [Rhodospirillaceae bacterium]